MATTCKCTGRLESTQNMKNIEELVGIIDLIIKLKEKGQDGLETSFIHTILDKIGGLIQTTYANTRTNDTQMELNRICDLLGKLKPLCESRDSALTDACFRLEIFVLQKTQDLIGALKF